MLALPLIASLLPISAFAKHSHHSHSASVYLFNPSSSSSSSGPLSTSTSSSSSHTPPDANAVISAFLNIEEYEMLRDGLELPEQIVFGASHGLGDEVQEQAHERQQPLLILADKMGKEGSIQDYISQSTLEARPYHALEISKSPESSSWHGLVSKYTERLSEKFGFALSSSENDAEEHVKRFLLPGSLNGEYAVDGSMQNEAYAPYLASLAELASLEQSKNSRVHLTGLREIAHTYGRSSDELKKAKEMMQLSVDSVIASHSGKIAFFLVPSAHHRKPHKQLRGSSSIDIFSTYPRHHQKRQSVSARDSVSPLVPTTSQCFSSADTCSNSTNSCSGHGACVQGKRAGINGKFGNTKDGQECWVCKCSNGEDDNGRMRYYSGEFCQKEDRSSQFFLLVGSTFLLVLISVASVALLSSVGSEPLPSTLAALGGGHGGHAKRD